MSCLRRSFFNLAVVLWLLAAVPLTRYVTGIDTLWQTMVTFSPMFSAAILLAWLLKGRNHEWG